ncbi:YVTN repeat-like/Quino protein amine dehydrogenase [Rhizopogon vinicolor AM-OR11-026]|uniref:YVTN repeat-like/Quino protein amine dehydrogenase n=1 Tax=Rhizopogon vinicolor AM-OR11-026 TaxID=1314800 RepID=A0A1B7N7D8_9AGAM|nr:YVTN repeat-like/Quino protein amine dehydrogenase [Rhizopogon vinicolor AM-OR11-026]
MTSHFHGEDDASSKGPTPHTQKKKPQAHMTLKGHEQSVAGLAIVPTTRLVVTRSSNVIWLWDLNKGKQVGELLSGGAPVAPIAVSPDGRWIVGGALDGSILVWDVATRKRVPVSFKGHENAILNIAFAPDSDTFASASYDHTVCVWLRKTGKMVLTMEPPQECGTLYSVSYSPDGSKLAVGYSERVVIWNVATGEEMLKIDSGNGLVEFTPDGRRLIADYGDDTRILDADTGEVIRQLDVGGSPVVPPISPDGTKFATLQEERIQFFDLTTFDPIGQPLEHPERVLCAAISEDGQLIATGCEDKLIRIWRVPESDSEKASQKNPRKVRVGPSTLSETIPRIQSRRERTVLLRGFFDDTEGTYPPRRSNQSARASSQRLSHIKDFVNRLTFRSQSQPAQPEETHLRRSIPVRQFLRQHLSSPKSRTRHEPSVVEVEVAAGRKFTRLAAVNLPKYRKVDDTRRQPRELPTVSQGMENDPPFESSDNDSLPDVHWCMALFCYRSCWSRGTLRMPSRWRLERVDQPDQGRMTSNTTHAPT